MIAELFWRATQPHTSIDAVYNVGRSLKHLSQPPSYLGDYTIKIDIGEIFHCLIIFPSEIIS